MLRLQRREVNFGERMFLLCGHGNPPGTSSCDKAQVIAAARSEWSNLSPAMHPGKHGSPHTQRGCSGVLASAASLEALWNLTVLCYGLRILS